MVAAARINVFRRLAEARSQLRHRREMPLQPLPFRRVVGEHAEPQVDADGIVASLSAVLRVDRPALPRFPLQPVRGEAFRRPRQQQAAGVGGEFAPDCIHQGETRQLLQRQVAGIETPAFGAVEAVVARQQHQPQPRQLAHGLSCAAPEQLLPQRGVVRPPPQATGLQQAVGEPQVGIAGIVVVEHAPVAIVGASPLPGRQAMAELAGGEIVLRPLQQAGEAVAIVGEQGKEQAVALPFRGGYQAWRGAVDDTSVRTHHRLLERFPRRPRALRRCGDAPRRAQQQGEETHRKAAHALRRPRPGAGAPPSAARATAGRRPARH